MAHWRLVTRQGFRDGVRVAELCGLDSPTGLWVVLLTNGVHAGRDASAVKALRRDLHTAVAAALLPQPSERFSNGSGVG